MVPPPRNRRRFPVATWLLTQYPACFLALAFLQVPLQAANLYWDFSPGTANGASNGGGVTATPGSWLGSANWDTGSTYQLWADGNDAFIAGASALQLTGNVTTNTLNITTGKVIIQSDAAANNHVLTLTNGGTIATNASVTFGSELSNSSGNERSLDVRLGGDINTNSTVGGNLDFFGGTILSSTSTASRTLYTNVRIGFAQGNTNGVVVTFGNSINNGSLLINGSLSTFGGSRRIDVVSGVTVEASGNFVNANSTTAASLTQAGGGTLKVGGVSSNSAINTFVIGAGSDTSTLELTGNGVMSSTGSATGTMANNFAINSANATLIFNSTFSQSATAGAQTFSGVISGAGKVVQAGAGTLALANTNTYTGTTSVSGGVLQVGSAGVGTTGTGAVTVQNGGTLLGTGIVRGGSFTAQSGSIIHVGDGSATTDFGTLSFTPSSGSGSFNFASGSSTVLGLNPGGTGDLLNFNGLSAGTLTFDGNLTVTAPGYVPASVQTFNLLDWANLSTTTFASRYQAGSYSDFLLGNGDDNLGFDLPNIAGSGYGWDISQFITNGTISTVMLVPEPGRFSMLLASVCGLLLRRRRMIA